MAVFAMLFGTRHIDATEHQHGLMLAVATESVVKLAAFLTVGVFVTFSMFGGPAALFERRPEAIGDPLGRVRARVPRRCVDDRDAPEPGRAIILLPRQFHVAIVENNRRRDPPGGMDVPALFLADQPVRGPDRQRPGS